MGKMRGGGYSPAATFTLLENMKTWCKIQVKINISIYITLLQLKCSAYNVLLNPGKSEFFP